MTRCPISPLPTTIEPDGVGRYPREVEAAVYFCALEAMQNIAKYAGASSCQLRIWQNDGELCFSVADDGTGFDASTTAKGAGLQNMADRLAALDGRLVVRSRAGGGTTIEGRFPVGRHLVVSEPGTGAAPA